MPDFRDRLRERLAAEGVMPSAHAEAIDEIAEHLSDLHAAKVREGLSGADADALVEADLARMGPLAIAVGERAKKRASARGRQDWSGGLITDLRQAIRGMRLNPGFTAIVVATLAIGVGSCTAVFSIINALLLGSLPYPHPEQLTLAFETDQDRRENAFIVAYPNYEDWKR